MRMRGFEPPRGCPHWHLKPARLPIPPHPQDDFPQTGFKLSTRYKRCRTGSSRLKSTQGSNSSKPPGSKPIPVNQQSPINGRIVYANPPLRGRTDLGFKATANSTTAGVGRGAVGINGARSFEAASRLDEQRVRTARKGRDCRNGRPPAPCRPQRPRDQARKSGPVERSQRGPKFIDDRQVAVSATSAAVTKALRAKLPDQTRKICNAHRSL